MLKVKNEFDHATVQAYDPFFLHRRVEGIQAFQKQVEQVSQKLVKVAANSDRPFKGKTSDEIASDIRKVVSFHAEGQSMEEVLEEIQGPVLDHSLHVSHEKSMAHLHCPPLIPGIMAELMIGTLNQSMDSWDQSPAATYVEEELIDYLIGKTRLPETADGVFTSGGTQSNYMGLLLARDSFCHSNWNHNVQQQGLPEGFSRLRILCSEDAHFTVKKSAAQLGLGEQAVVTIQTDSQQRMCMTDLDAKMKMLKNQDLLPFAITATCGTTDFGSIDPMEELAKFAEHHNIWLHVDAAFGGGLLFSHAHREKLTGLNQADSITLDFHKLFYQPVSCGVFFVKDQSNFQYLSHHADYLNPVRDEEEGILNLVNKSVQTTRRFDALKVLLTLKTIGTDLLGSMIDDTLELARYAAYHIEGTKDLAIENSSPEINTIIFRYQPEDDKNQDLNEVNRNIQQTLFHQGKAVIAKTVLCGETYLKLTLLNPRTTPDDIRAVMKDIEEIGKSLVNGGEKL